MKLLQILFVLVTLYTTACLAEWQLVWKDEFDGMGLLNESLWEYDIGCEGWGNNELQCYLAQRTENVRQENGSLVIDVKVEDIQGHSYSSGRIKSLQSWAYGKFEARAKMPSGHHLWPAIWLFPKYQKYGMWAASGEIDIMELKGDKPNVIQGTMHYGGSWPNQAYHGSGEITFDFDFSKDFHTFSLEWDQKEMRWYVDGKQFHTESIDKPLWSGKGPNPYTKNGQPFDQQFHWILNCAVGGQFFGPGPYVTPAEAKNWAKHTVEFDYVRVYEWKA